MTPSDAPQTERTPWNRRDWLILLAVLLLGGALRFWHLGVNPPGFQFDEAFNAIDAEQVLHGNRPLFLPANGGREVLFTYVQAGLIAIFGSSVWSFRLASALWGTAAVGAAYLLFRFLLKRDSRLIASFGALALAISYWHIHFSHFGIRVITMPVIFSALFGTFYAATQARTRTRRLLLYALAGVLLGCSVWSNPTGRLAPFVLIAWLGVLLWRKKGMRTWRIDGPVLGLLITGIAAFIVFLPLGLEFVRNPDFFFGHASEVSVFAERVSGDSGPLVALADNILHVLGMFTFYGDLEWTHGIPGRPVLDWIIGIPFYIGVVIWALRLFGKGRKVDEDGDALWLLALWVVVMLAPSVLSEAAPNYSRTLPALPAVLLPIGLGLAWIVRRRWRPEWLGFALAGSILVGSLVWTYYDYFVRFPQMEGAYYGWEVDKADALAALKARGDDHQLFLSPLWAEHAPVRWARGGSGIKTLDPGQAIVLPQAGGAVYAYTSEEGERAQTLADRLNGLLGEAGSDANVTVEAVHDRYEKPLLWLVTLEGDQVALLRGEGQTIARFDDAPSLVDAMLDDAGNVVMSWRAEAPTFRNLTAFVHMIDRDGNRVAQADRIPGDGSYATPTWSTGELVVDTIPLDIVDPCVGGDAVRLVTGWYEYAADGARRMRLDAPGDVAVTGDVTMPLRPLGEEHVTPATLFPQPAVFGPLTLLGYTLHEADRLQEGENLRGGTPITLDLYYRLEEATLPLPAALITRDIDIFANHGNALIPSQPLAEPGNYCQRLRLQVAPALDFSNGAVLDWSGVEEPTNLAIRLLSSDFTVAPDSGAGLSAGFTADLPAGAVEWGSPYITPFVIHPADAPSPLPDGFGQVGAILGDQIELQGYMAGEVNEGALSVTVAWRATKTPNYPNSAFVQLLTQDGVFVTGSDVQPAPPTQRWTPGEAHETLHNLTLPAALPSGEYRLVAGLYDALTHERLLATDSAGASLPDNLVPLGQVFIDE